MVVESVCNTAGRGESAAGLNDKTVARMDRARRRRQNVEQEYRDEVYRQWLAAEAATNGYMLHPAGRRSGIDERSLFVGPESRVRKYASPELVDWLSPTRARPEPPGSGRRPPATRTGPAAGSADGARRA
jgi:hypothetical protein